VRAATPGQERAARDLQRAGTIPADGPPSHAFGMVGFIKELVDECGAADASLGHVNNLNTPPKRLSRIAQLVIKPYIVFAFKPEAAGPGVQAPASAQFVGPDGLPLAKD
jgi:hypothetical protein